VTPVRDVGALAALGLVMLMATLNVSLLAWVFD